MKIIYKLIFEFLTEPLGLPINLIFEYLILLIIGEFAFRIAWNVSPGGFWGSEIHWIVRVVTYVLMWGLTYGLIMLVKFLTNNYVVALFAFAIITLTALLLILLRYKRLNNKYIK